jgi:HEAT repeat protein
MENKTSDYLSMGLRCFAVLSLRATLVSVGLYGGICLAQEDPFGASPKPAGGTPAAAAGAKPAARPTVVEREPLVIELLRASNPTSPEQLLSAAQTAFQFGRLDEAKTLLAKLLAEKPADEALAPLTARYANFLLQIGALKDLQPEGKEVADIVLSAAQRVAQDQTRIESAITQLNNPDQAARRVAIEQLSRSGAAAVNPILLTLADASRAAEHAAVRAALVQIGQPVEAPLIAALDTKNELLKNQVIAVLGRLGSRRADLFLIRLALDAQSPAETRQLAAAVLHRIHGAIPNLYEGEKYLNDQILRLLKGEIPFDSDQNDRVNLWTWDESTQQVTPGQLPRPDAGLLLAARAASYLYVLKSGEPAAQRLMLVTNLELAKTLGGFNRPISTKAGSAGAVALAAGPEMLNGVVSEALRMGKTGAAAAAAELLGQLGDISALKTSGPETPLAEALGSSDRRVRLAAALAAARISKGEPFSGAGRMVETLGWFISTGGINSVLIGHPRGEEAQSLVGFVNSLGFEGQGAYSGRVLAERAFTSSDFAFVLIADAIDGPPVEELVQWLRRDYRTARLPIGVMARGERLLKLEDAFSGDRYTTVFPRIYSVEVCGIEINKLLAIAGRDFVDRDERIAQANAALAALKMLAEQPAVFAQYDLLSQQNIVIAALANPALTTAAAALLTYYPTPAAQTALVDFASQSNRPLADRQAAASAFAESVRARGVLLTQAQIAQQFARYNASQSADKGTQELLGSILDAIEAPALARGELKKLP